MSITTCHPSHVPSEMMSNLHNAAVDACDTSILAALKIAVSTEISYDDEEDYFREVAVWFSNNGDEDVVFSWCPNDGWYENDKVVKYLCGRIGKLCPRPGDIIDLPPPIGKVTSDDDSGHTGSVQQTGQVSYKYYIKGNEVPPQELVQYLMEQNERLRLALENEQDALAEANDHADRQQ